MVLGLTRVGLKRVNWVCTIRYSPYQALTRLRYYHRKHFLNIFFADACSNCSHVVASHVHEFWIESGYQVC